MSFKRSTVALFMAAMGWGTQALAMPLEEELRGLLVSHPLLNSARKTVGASDKGRDVAAAGFYPRVSVAGDMGQETINSESYRPDAAAKLGGNGTVTPVTNSTLNRQKFSATIEQNLYAGGRTQATADMAEIEYAAKQNSLQASTQDVLLEAITAYLQVGRYQTLKSLARQNEVTTKRQLTLENQRVELGGGIAVDVLQARTRLQLVRERRVFYEQGLRDASANYQQVFGHAPDLAQIQDLDIFAQRIPATLEAAIDQGRDQNPRLKEAFYDSRKAQKQISVERSGWFPSIDLVGTQVQDTNVSAVAKRDETSVLLKFNWTLFSGMETKNRTAAAGMNYDATVDREASVVSKTDEAVRIAWNQLINGHERVELLESATSISRDVMQSRKRLRDAGKETAINVLDAEVEYFGVLSNKVNAINETRLGSYRLLAAIGALTPQSLGLEGGEFALPVKPLTLDIESLGAKAP